MSQRPRSSAAPAWLFSRHGLWQPQISASIAEKKWSCCCELTPDSWVHVYPCSPPHSMADRGKLRSAGKLCADPGYGRLRKTLGLDGRLQEMGVLRWDRTDRQSFALAKENTVVVLETGLVQYRLASNSLCQGKPYPSNLLPPSPPKNRNNTQLTQC